jgi:hypothetical protein
MVATRKRQVRLLTAFMFIFAVLFLWIFFDKNIPLKETIVGCAVLGSIFGLLAIDYIKVLNR